MQDSSFKKVAQSIDIFGMPFDFRIHHAHTKYKTVCGCILTFAMLLPILPFAAYKYSVMRSYGDSNILITEQQNFFEEDYVLSFQKQNFNVAFAFVNWDAEDPNADFSEYGELKVFYKRWGHGESGTSYR